MERWQAKAQDDKKLWANFRTHYITEYEKLLAESGGTTLGQEGYGGAFNATETNEASLTESIVRYAEKTTAAESKVSELENRLAQLEMDGQAPSQAPPPYTGYYAPEAAYFTSQQVPPTIHVSPPQQFGMPPPPQQYGGQQTY